tara:strand:+ start:124 stop:876 length:753 start_codon:yes stop_codon:yes gene_type:complete
MKSFLHLPPLYILLVAIFTSQVLAPPAENAQPIFDSNIQSAYDPSDTPESAAAPIQAIVPISSSTTEAVEKNVEEAVEITVATAAIILGGGEESQVALNNFVQEQNYNLTNSSDIDQIVGALENELSSSPERSASFAVTLSTLVTADFITSEALSVGAINSSSIVVAVQKSMNIIAQSSKFNQLITATNVVNVKQGVVSSVTKLLEDSGLSGEELAAALKQIEEIVESQLETITVDSGSTDVGPLAQESP